MIFNSENLSFTWETGNLSCIVSFTLENQISVTLSPKPVFLESKTCPVSIPGFEMLSKYLTDKVIVEINSSLMLSPKRPSNKN